MINFENMSEQLMLNTVKIRTKTGSGTGFIFDIKSEKGSHIPILITNSHVVNRKKKEIINLTLHMSEKNLEDNLDITLELMWQHHDEYDLCFAYVGDILNKIREKYKVFPRTKFIAEKFILKEQKLELLEQVTMIGYPIGLYDEKHNLPIFRKGHTASHPNLDFNGRKEGVVDMACFPGSSGSPIFILNNGVYSDENGVVMGRRLIFLGILYGGPVHNIKGELEIKEIALKPIPSVDIMTNLGYYIKAEVILDFKEVVLRQLGEKEK